MIPRGVMEKNERKKRYRSWKPKSNLFERKKKKIGLQVLKAAFIRLKLDILFCKSKLAIFLFFRILAQEVNNFFLLFEIK